ncbi:ammonia-forming cytochrome c nitrite reductase subunit c552 [Rhodovibrionaceae bacterium A322]
MASGSASSQAENTTKKTAEKGTGNRAEKPAYVSSESCQQCHQQEAEDWQGSHHSWAWNDPTSDRVLGDFKDSVFEHHGIQTRFRSDEEGYWIETADQDGKPQRYDIAYTVGVSPLQQYLIEGPGGRLQVLDIAWDSQKDRWFMVFPDQQDNVPGNALHWSGVYKNWNGRCAECHATNYQKNYRPQSRSFDSNWSEKGVTCQACHGPGEAHLAWAGDPSGFDVNTYAGVNDLGLPTASHVKTSGGLFASPELEACTACHSRRSAYADRSPAFGTAFSDSYDLAGLRSGLYHPDGQILDEVYVAGSFLQSKMYQAGVTCLDCHDPHSGETKAADNSLCTQCHSPAGNSRFSSLEPKLYDRWEHSKHTSGQPGSFCVDCHMPAQTYMQVDPRRDHRMGIPDPLRSNQLGSPNACQSCHLDQTATWVEEAYAKLFSGNDQSSGSEASKLDFATVFHTHDRALAQGQLDPVGTFDLLKLARDDQLPALIRASALERLSAYANRLYWPELAVFLQDPDPLIRSAAAKLYQAAPVEQKLRALGPALSDPSRSVRIPAARALMHAPQNSLTRAQRQALQQAAREFQFSLLANADHPNNQLAMARLALSFRNAKAAHAALNEALWMDPQFPDAWILKARLQMAEQRPDQVRKTMADALMALPGSAPLHHFFGNYLAGQRQYRTAIELLEQASTLPDADPVISRDLAVVLSQAGRNEDARDRLKNYLKDQQEDLVAQELLAQIFLQLGQTDEARVTVQSLKAQAPDHPLPANLQTLLP